MTWCTFAFILLTSCRPSQLAACTPIVAIGVLSSGALTAHFEKKKKILNSANALLALTRRCGVSVCIRCSLTHLQVPVWAPVFDRYKFFGTSEALQKSPGWKFIILMNEIMNYTACCWFPWTSQQYFNDFHHSTLSNQVLKVAWLQLFKVPNRPGVFTVVLQISMTFLLQMASDIRILLMMKVLKLNTFKLGKNITQSFFLLYSMFSKGIVPDAFRSKLINI